MENEILIILLNEREKLLREKKKNLEKIKIIDDKISECEKNARHYATVSFLKNREIEKYRQKNLALKKTNHFDFIKIISCTYKNIKINFLEKENQVFEEKRIHYQNQTIYYKETKINLENETINLNKKIYTIDNQLNKEQTIENHQKVLKRR